MKVFLTIFFILSTLFLFSCTSTKNITKETSDNTNIIDISEENTIEIENVLEIEEIVEIKKEPTESEIFIKKLHIKFHRWFITIIKTASAIIYR